MRRPESFMRPKQDTFHMPYPPHRIAGVLVFVGAAQFIIGLISAEALYPGYSTSRNFISDLGATCRETCIIQQPTATIFNSSVILLGLLVVVSSYFIQRAFRKTVLSVLFAIAGVGAIGVGLFPETFGVVHSIVSLLVFLFGGLSAIVAYIIEKPPLSYFSVVMGVVTLVALVLFSTDNFLGLGQGGMERLIAYPVLLWAVGFGGYLMASPAEQKLAV